uniref:Haemocyanin n=1 Tax=Nautilus pompilius TaxID=34573 RepID=I7H9I6_9MOLL|nr:haemocyanin precursor [Nautilus pompilius]
MATHWHSLLLFSLQLLVFTYATSDPTNIRKNVADLTHDVALNLQIALRTMQDDNSPIGFQAVAAYHGEPASCIDSHENLVVCCLHGMPTFPHWHRLYTTHLEQSLLALGTTLGLPYWDWTQPMTHLPNIVQHPLFIDPNGGKAKKNVFYSGTIGFKKMQTARAVDERLFSQPEPGHHTFLFEGILDALEQTDYCQFEVQFEIIHNAIHYLVGGQFPHSMSSLEFTSYDPLFFLHHSNVDRLFSIWQALQRHRGLPSGHSNCAKELFTVPMKPFNEDSNPIQLTHDHALPSQLFDHTKLLYQYDDLTLNGLNITQVQELIEKRRSHARAFASFRLSGIHTSANVRVHVCVRIDDDKSHDDCDHVAGNFFILGGAREMEWHYHYPYRFDITSTVQELGIALDSNYYVDIDLIAINGTLLSSSLIPNPTVDYQPAPGSSDPPMRQIDREKLVVRKDLRRLHDTEEFGLRQAMARFMKDESIDGFQALAEYHGLPARCLTPEGNRIACCIHGMATFPHWHRLFVLQVEDALIRRGSPIGIPYWDWARPMISLPHLIADETYINPYSNKSVPNPFHHGSIDFLHDHITTQRDIKQETLFEQPAFGDHTYLFDGLMYALEQDDFCDFEIQFEIVHNGIHAWTGGQQTYSMSSLHFTSFDPLFFLHHSNVDRIWAIWQALQIYRGKHYLAHCANSEVHSPMRPFSFPSPRNPNPRTFTHATPTDIYDYEAELGYTFDTLDFGGRSIPDLQNEIEEHQRHDRTFAGFLFWGIHTSTNGKVFVDVIGQATYNAGTIAILGGTKEMTWRFDRLYHFEISEALKALGKTADDEFSLHVKIHDVNGSRLSNDIIPAPNIIFVPAHVKSMNISHKGHTRRNINSLTQESLYELRQALTSFMADTENTGFQRYAAFHGFPEWCPSPDAEHKFACCVHGMPTFVHWHRLLTIQFENGIRNHGYQCGLPYWDWTEAITHLPESLTAAKYTDPHSNEMHHNPLHNGHIDSVNADTMRNINEKLFEQPEFGHFTLLANQVILALEQENFCDFSVQFEISHNEIHALVGGTEPYSMASLTYTAFDPLFMLHHSNVDRIWAIWQSLQQYRGHPHKSANCALQQLHQPLSPFSLTSEVNPDPETREHSKPMDVFDYEHNFHYHYDNLELLGMSIPQLSREINRRRSRNRVFAGFMLHGFKKSALVSFSILHHQTDETYAGEFYILGSEDEMPWHYDRLYRYEITDILNELHLQYTDPLRITYRINDLHNKVVEGEEFSPTVLYVPALGTYGTQTKWREPVTSASRIRKDLNTLTDGELESLRNAFLRLQEEGAYEPIAAFHGVPAKCRGEDGNIYTCCVHGMPTFPHWHRLYVIQVEHALRERGSGVSVPYWDWTKRFNHLPALMDESTFYNSRKNEMNTNPFHRGSISFINSHTSRDFQPELFNSDYLYENTLLALEQNDFCNFEVQLEVLHNAIHAWIGGRDTYSMSSLDYAAYDPIFFIHHSTLDRIWAIWQELQRYRGLPYNEANCALPLMNQHLRPFNNVSVNHDRNTLTLNKPNDAFDYQNHFHYRYDNLDFHGLSIPQLEHELHERQTHDRVFVGFLLHGIQASAYVRIYICVPTQRGSSKENCNNYAGIFSILGGVTEMPWHFDRLYYYEITHALSNLGLSHRSHFRIKTDINAVNGTHFDSHIFPDPTISFVPAPGSKNATHYQEEEHHHFVRKEVSRLSIYEIHEVVYAFRRMQRDMSADGFEYIASYHADPPLCPNPKALHRYACCIHGMATFLHWHRLYVVQFEQSLHRHGSDIGFPYWDWTRPITHIPALLKDVNYTDPFTNSVVGNPFNHGHLSFISPEVMTQRDVQDKLFKQPKLGRNTWLHDNVILALEQTDYCNFEVQFEIVHNAIHAWVGGSQEHSLSHLHFAAYDPAFYLHHSNVDRIWVIWQELQKIRGLSAYEANCALELMNEPLKPFAFGSPYNLNEMTRKYSLPEDTFNYKDHFDYEYDMLEFSGMTIPQLEDYIKESLHHERIFAGFLLHGIGQSANVDFEVCDNQNHCEDAGYFSILGGSLEMPWAFNRLYRYDITHTLETMHLNYDDNFHINIHIHDMAGNDLDSHLLQKATILRQPAAEHHEVHHPLNRIRHNINDLSERDIQSLKSALIKVKEDHSNFGFQTITSYHGLPASCPTPEEATYACCMHGMAAFPHWHRLYALQFEESLLRHGSSVALPYWDWTHKITGLPHLLSNPDYYDALHKQVTENPFLRGHIEVAETYTVRNTQPELFEPSKDGKHSLLYDEILLALEQRDYCDFEVQFEVVHNAIHYLVGGHQRYSMSSLEYASYDPLFFIHHSNVDRLWAIWQALQQYRRIPYNKAYCALEQMTHAMKPFDRETNPNKNTHDHAIPNSVFNYDDLGYSYDNLLFDGLTITELEEKIHSRQSHPRVFAGFLLHAIGTSADVHVSVCHHGNNCTSAGLFFILGGKHEMPWKYDRLFRYDITDAVTKAGFSPEDVFNDNLLYKIHTEINAVNGSHIDSHIMHEPTLIFVPGRNTKQAERERRISGGPIIRKNINKLTSSEIHELREAMAAVQADHSSNGYQAIAAYHGLPLQCKPYACCQHGMPTFPHWHRLYVKQMEDTLHTHGSHLGIPYWDWTEAFEYLPILVTETEHNPFHHAKIEFINETTSRNPRPQLFTDQRYGETSFFYRQILLALEQTDFCDFEIQFEVGHNAIHSWVGGSTQYGMSTLHFTSYDPLFYIHHSNTDRIWAIWQALQRYRGLPYNSANCEIHLLKKPLEPFSFESNPNHETHNHSTGNAVFDYHQLGYEYDTLEFHGHNIPQLAVYLDSYHEHDRVFAGFLLHGIKRSADVNFDICSLNGDCTNAGTFALLGGEHEMPWAFDRLFKYDITKPLQNLRLHSTDDFSINIHIVAINGEELDSHLIPTPSIIFSPGRGAQH